MPATRSSTRVGGNSSASPASNPSSTPSSSKKRKAATSASTTPSKESKKPKKQATLEETLDDYATGNKDHEDGENGTKEEQEEAKDESTSKLNDDAETDVKAESKGEPSKESNEESKPAQNGTSTEKVIQQPTERKEEMPQSVVEKGIFYFFTRGRVGIEEPSNVNEIARSYLVLRPLPLDTKLGEGPIPELSNLRLVAVPKKVLPVGPKDRFMVFVEKGETDVKTLKDDFLSGSTYETQTAGTRHTPPPMPLGEGVYAITHSDRSAHLAYMLTIPADVGEVQKSVGLADKGSFVLSTKNPKYEGPANAQLPEDPGFPSEVIEEFKARRWMPSKPEHLNYANAQFLLIGEGHDEFKSALQATEEDNKSSEKETPQEELEKLEEEDEKRAQAIDFESVVFKDLEINKNDFPKVKTTW